MTEITDEEMAELLEEATEGGWEWNGKLLWGENDVIASGDMDGLLQINQEDAEFIVAAKAWIPKALERLKDTA